MRTQQNGNYAVVAIGECMLELSDGPSGCRISFGGDTLNTALYMARLGVNVEYVTALGDDPYSDWMIAQWSAEGIGVRFVTRVEGRLPGIYTIRTEGDGERRFYYWRQNSAARDLLKGRNADVVATALSQASLIYLSGITLSILDDEQRELLLMLLSKVRNENNPIAIDPNYRPASWPDAATARRWLDAFYRLSTYALPSLDDEQALGVADDPSASINRLHKFGVSEVVVKVGGDGCCISTGGTSLTVPVNRAVCIDSTAAGDSFNAGYLAGRLKGMAPDEAAALGNRLAGAVVARAGAIIPIEAMPQVGPRIGKPR